MKTPGSRGQLFRDASTWWWTLAWAFGPMRMLAGMLLVTALSLSAACGDIEISLGDGDDGPVETRSDAFNVGASPRLVVDTFNGGITVVAGTEGVIEVEATLRRADKVEYQASQSGGTVRVEADQKGTTIGRSPGAAIEVTVPPFTVVELETSNGPVEVRGLRTSAHLRTSNGKITVEDHTGDLDATTSNGQIQVTGLIGTVDLETSNGGINFTGELASGSDNEMTTSNSGVTVKLEGTPSVRLDASTSNGTVSSELPFTAVSTGRTRLEGTIGGGAAGLRIRSSNGSITVR